MRRPLREIEIILSGSLLLAASLILFQGCKEAGDNKEALATDFLDAFYAFDAGTMGEILQHAGDSREGILSYQGWAEGGHYEVLDRRPLVHVNDSTIICPVTVKDDLIGALELDLNVTDSFHLTFHDGQIVSVETSSNDPPLFYEARQWVRKNRPELTRIPCGGKENGGSPGDCVRAVVAGFREFVALRNSG